VSGPRGAAELGAALEAALLRQLAETWEEINGNHFRRRLERPAFLLHDGDSRLGAWNGVRRTISLSRALVLDRPWGVVREVLKHEMAHQFVEEVLGERDETAHGPTFERVCRQFGFDAAAAGLPEAALPGREQPVLRRVTKLLALAESSNRHEAEAAMAEARRLMLKHNIEEAVAAAREGFSFRHVGIAKRRTDAHEQLLAGILGDHFFVEVIWVPSYLAREGKRGRVLELCGTIANLEVAAYVHGFLLETGERLWREHKRAAKIRGDKERRRFLVGVMMGFREKLEQGAKRSQEEGLVWVGDPALEAYLKRRYPRRSGGGAIGLQRTAAYEQGRAAGRGIVLHRPVHGSAARGRLLTGGG
jgi:hypothetical protein